MNGLYVYESHLGELYTCAYEIDEDTLFCETCGDYDWCVGFANNREQAWGLLEDLGYTIEYITGFIEEHWEE